MSFGWSVVAVPIGWSVGCSVGCVLLTGKYARKVGVPYLNRKPQRGGRAVGYPAYGVSFLYSMSCASMAAWQRAAGG
jgi:hypothetical protein